MSVLTGTGLSTAQRAAPLPADLQELPERRVLYVFSPLPPQRNGLADYLLAYLPMLAQDFELTLVAESGRRDAARLALATWLPESGAGWQVLDEAEFRARQPDGRAQVLYNIGNNGDCAYQLDYLHRFPGAVIVHDISLFYLHQVATQQAHAHHLLSAWLQEDGYRIPDEFVGPRGALTSTPGELYQECLMLHRLVGSAQGVMVHTEYAQTRLAGSVQPGPNAGTALPCPLARIPHFVLPPPQVPPRRAAEVLARHDLAPSDFVMLVPGFLTGNKMLYEVMVAFHRLQARCPEAKLLFAGEERPDEYAVSRRIAQLWPSGSAPQVTGYLDADELDVLLQRADLSFVLRFPTYGESSGILPRAAMGGGCVLTVNIGAYPEFHSAQVQAVPVGGAAIDALEQGIVTAYLQWLDDTPAARQQRCLAEAERLQPLSPARLYPALRAWLDQSWESRT